MVTSARAEPGSRKKIRTGVAISAGEICAADIRLRGSSEPSWRAALEPPPSDAAGWPSLASALAELARTLGVTEGTLAISLMPPLTEVRRLELPPLTDDELQRLLARNASRYFVNARGTQIVGASAATRECAEVPRRSSRLPRRRDSSRRSERLPSKRDGRWKASRRPRVHGGMRRSLSGPRSRVRIRMRSSPTTIARICCSSRTAGLPLFAASERDRPTRR
jgi:hypothetical protein